MFCLLGTVLLRRHQLTSIGTAGHIVDWRYGHTVQKHDDIQTIKTCLTLFLKSNIRLQLEKYFNI